MILVIRNRIIYLQSNILNFSFRRARENKGILQKLEKEKLLLRRELFDRIKKGQLIYNPQGDYIPVGFKSVPVIPS